MTFIPIPNYIANDGVVKAFHCMLKALFYNANHYTFYSVLVLLWLHMLPRMHYIGGNVPINRWNSLTIHDHIIIIIQCHVVQILVKNFT